MLQGRDCPNLTWDGASKAAVAQMKSDNLVVIVASNAIPVMTTNIGRALNDCELVVPR